MIASCREGYSENHFQSYALWECTLQLFGSKARGDATKFSDVDVLVILDDATWEDRRSVSRITSDVLLETGVDLSAKTFSPNQLDEMKRQRSMFWQTIESDLRPIEP